MTETTHRTLDTAAAVDDILELAGRAPSVHNTQPWRWRVHGTHVDLYADFRRQLVYADPQRRDLLISCGAALHHLQVAAGALGWSTRVRRAPDPGDDRFVASVELGHRRSAAAEAAETLAALRRRVTDRRRLSSWPVPSDRLNSLAMTGSGWGAQVLPVEDEATKALLERLTHRADVVQRRNPRYVHELDAWTTTSPTAAEGIPVRNVPVPETVDSADAVNRRFPHGVLEDDAFDAGPPASGMLLICTSSDDAVSRIRAGEALSAVWLQATRENMSVVPLSQALEVESTRRELQDGVLGDLACAQLVLRVGWSPLSGGHLTPTPRRPLEETRTRY